MSKKLDDIRKTIDSLDTQIHDLLMQRAVLVSDIKDEKKKKNLPAIQPAREAALIRKILLRHEGPLPEGTVIGIWREIIGAMSVLQMQVSVQVGLEKGEEYCWDLAQEFFGNVVPVSRSSSAVMAVSGLRQDECSFATVPWPHDGEHNPWWAYLFNPDENPMRIVAALPFGSDRPFREIHDKAVILAKTAYAPSGEDRSFIGVEVDHSVSRARIVDVLKELGLEAISMYTKSGVEVQGESLHMIEVDAFVGEGDERLSALAGRFENENMRCLSLGGYPVPPVIKGAKAASASASPFPKAPSSSKSSSI